MAAPSHTLRFPTGLTIVLLLALATDTARLPAEEPPSTTKSDVNRQAAIKPADRDVLAVVREWNSSKHQQPSADFHPGAVTPRKLDPTSVQKTKNGFTVKLPSGTPIPTLTVYDGKLYASGGFHSREFYCFDAASGKPIWAVDLDDDGPTSAVASDGVIIFNTESCTIFALDANSGKMLWSWYLADPLVATPTVGDGRVFTAYPNRGFADAKQAAAAGPAGNGGGPDKPKPAGKAAANVQTTNPPTHALACFDLKTGKVLWQRWIDADVMTAPVMAKDDVCFASLGGAIYRFHAADGAIRSAKSVRATSAPVVVGRDIFFTRRADDKSGKTVEEALVKTDWQLSKELFVALRRKAPQLDATVQENSKFGAQSGQLGGMNGIGGGGFGGGGAFQIADNPAKANPTGGDSKKSANGNTAVPAANSSVAGNVGIDNVCGLQGFQGSRVVNVGAMNFNCMGDEVFGTDAGSGKVLWSRKLEGDIKKEGGSLAAPPAAAGGQIFLATLKGEVLQIEPSNGAIAHRYPVGAPLRFQPTVQDGRIYVGTQDGRIVCIDTGEKKFTGWSTWGGNAAHTGVGNLAIK